MSSWQHFVKRRFQVRPPRCHSTRARPQVVQLEARTVLSFVLPKPLPVGHSPNAVAAVDLNGDGRLDLITANMGNADKPGNTVSVLLGNADGTFQEQHTFGVGT